MAATAAATQPVAGSYTAPWRREADAAADRNNLPRQLFRALIGAESGWNAKARSSAGAIGLTQLMPATARGLGVDPADPLQNLEGGARYLRAQLDRFGDVELALAAYNAGPGTVEQYGGVPPFSETRLYVDKVLAAAGNVAVDAATSIEDWLKPGTGVDLENVNASLLARLGLLGAYLGQPVTAISGFRSDAEQTRIWDSGVRPAARPIARGGEGSNHSRSQAVDATIDVDGKPTPIGAAVPAATLKEFGLKSLGSIDDPAHVEELEVTELAAAGVGLAAAAGVAAGIASKLAPKIASKLRGLLRGIGRGSAKTASGLGKYGTLGLLLAGLGVTGAIDLKRGALWLLFTLLGLALIVVGVLRLVGLKPGTVVNVTKEA